jgi:Tol biopolymer transport system component
VALAPGTRFGPYAIVAPLASGGMGEVYRAHDTRLQRDVAVKVIAELLANDPDRTRRFESEARAAGALAHPNLLAIFDVGTHEGRHYIVSELLEGSTLREAFTSAGLPPRKVVDWVAQIAQGLSAAHEKGIVHRDLKPENLFVTRDGRIKILDFGLAKTAAPVPGDGSTVDAATNPGRILGTAGYASPEQVRGLAADARADVFSLGAVAFEMLTGRRAFPGPTTVDTLHGILNDDPSFGMPGRTVPPALAAIVRRCLEKRPEERFQCARDVAYALQAVPLDAGEPASRTRAGRLAWIAAGLAGVAVLAVALRGPGRGPAPEPPVVRYVTHSGQDEEPAVSPDGHTIAFVSGRDGGQRIWLANLRTGEEAPLTDGPADDHPRFSPDGSALVFVRAEGDGASRLLKVPVLGGEPRRLIDDARAGADWSPDGRRLAFVRQARTGAPTAGLWVAEADGSNAREVASVPALWATPPRWSPDGRRVAFSHGQGAAVVWSTLIVDADAGGRQRLAPPLTFGMLSAPAWCCGGRSLVFIQSESGHGRLGGRLVRQDVATGRATTILREHAMGSGLDRVGGDGVLFDVYRTRGNLREERLDGTGAGGRWLTRAFGDDRQPVYASDGARIVFSSNRGGNLDLWELRRDDGRLRRLTDHASDDLDPHLMRDGRLLWSSMRSGSFEVWMAEPDGSSPRQVTRDGFDAENPSATPDGQWIVYTSSNPERQGIWKVHVDGTRESRLVGGASGLPEISPDGTHVLFSAYDPPRTTLRVLSLADGRPVPFEIDLGVLARSPRTRYIRGRGRWAADGREIVYVDEEGGVTGIFAQAFRPGQGTRASRRRLAGFDHERVTESFGLSPDGRTIVIATREVASHLLLATGVPGLDP